MKRVDRAKKKKNNYSYYNQTKLLITDWKLDEERAKLMNTEINR